MQLSDQISVQAATQKSGVTGEEHDTRAALIKLENSTNASYTTSWSRNARAHLQYILGQHDCGRSDWRFTDQHSFEDRRGSPGDMDPAGPDQFEC